MSSFRCIWEYIKMDMEQTLAVISSGMLLRQAATIVFLSALGYVFIWSVGSRCKKEVRVLLSFPAGLSFFCTGIFAMLVVKIRISVPRLIFVLVFAFAAVFALSLLYGKQTGNREKTDLKSFDIKIFLIMLAVSAAVAVFCCAGILSVSLDNDSYYYFSTYPQILIEEGDLKYEFDVLLTDTGIMAVIINAIPYIFGFLNTFGIQHFLNINFLLIFGYALYNELINSSLSNKKSACILSVAATVFLATNPAYITTAKWIMAGDYFMVFFFILMYFGYKETEGTQDMPFILMLFAIEASMLRQEGPIMIAFLIFCLSVLDYTNQKLVTVYLMPVLIAAGYYYLRIFVFLGVRPVYAFLTPQKALLIIALLGILIIYMILIRGRFFVRLQSRLIYLIPLLLIVANILMLLKNHTRYLTNLYAFFMNIRLRNGWGYFGYFFFVFLVIAVILAVKNKDFSINFFDMMMIGYILVAVCAAWGRGDSLRVGAGDSGNRVMLTAVPIITFAMVLRLFKKIPQGEAFK